MTLEQAEELLNNGDFEEWNHLRDNDEEIPSLAGITIGRVALSDINFRGLDLRRARFERTTLPNAKFQGADLRGAKFYSNQLRKARFDGAKMQGVQFIKFDDATPPDAYGAYFLGTNLSYANFGSTDLSHAKFEKAILIGTRGLYGDSKAKQGAILDAELAIFNHPRDYPSWAKLGSLGSIPLFGVSNITIVLIILYSNMIRWFNEQVAVMHDFAQEMAPESQWVGYLDQIPANSEYGWLLAALAVLAVGSGIYKFRSPDIVREYSWTKWVLELNKSPLEYGTLNYGQLPLRFTCAICYILGGIYVTGYLIWRMGSAMKYLLGI